MLIYHPPSASLELLTCDPYQMLVWDFACPQLKSPAGPGDFNAGQITVTFLV